MNDFVAETLICVWADTLSSTNAVDFYPNEH